MNNGKYFTPSKLEDSMQKVYSYYIDEIIECRNNYSLDIIKTVTRKEDWNKLKDIDNHIAYRRFITCDLGDIDDYLKLESECQDINMNDVITILLAVKGGVYRELRESVKKGGSNR